MSSIKTIHLILPFFFLLLSCNPKSPGTRTVQWDSLTELKPGEDASALVQRLLTETDDGAIVMIPQGTYHFYPDNAIGKYCIISNNDNGYYRIAFDISGRKSISIDAQGSEFVFHGHIIPFNLEDSENISLRNFSIDWQRTFHSEARVVKSSPQNNYFDISISTDFPYRIENNQLIWLEKLNENLWSRKEWRQDIGNNLYFDPKIGGTAYNVQRYKVNPYFPLLHTQYAAIQLPNGNIRISHDVAEIPDTGWIWVSKGQLNDNRTSPAIRIFGCSNAILENIDIHHAGAMGIIGERSENISLNNVNVVLPENKDRIVTTTADATHFVNCRGSITLENCLFENMLDDATNIHGTYLRLDHKIDSNRIGITAVHDQQNVLRWAEEGDTLVFLNNLTMEPYRKLLVKKFQLINERYAEVTFHENVEDLLLKSGVENPSWHPEFTMKGCTVRNNRARSILLSSPGRMIIENNHFIRPMMAAIAIAGDMNFWFESGQVTDLVIRDNVFTDCCTGGADQAIIQFEPNILIPEERLTPFHRNISIENNLFESFDKPVIHAFSVQNLVFRNNEVRQTNIFPALFPEKAGIHIEYSSDVSIENNTFKQESPTKLNVDKHSENIKLENNTGLDTGK